MHAGAPSAPRNVIDREGMLPPISALRAFLFSAQYRSFSKAADELGMTQSGVSRAIKSIEELAGATLFERTGHGLILTEQGRVYLDDVQTIVDELGAATLRLSTFADADETLSIATLPSLGGRWLAPRIRRFMAQYPRIEVRITAQIGHFDLANSGIDGVIHYGNDVWPDSLSEFLMDEVTVPACSPELLPADPAPIDALLRELTLIQHLHRPTAWRDWFRIAGLAHPHPMAGPRFEQYIMGIEAALSGMGAIMMPPFMMLSELRDKRLALLDRTVVQSPWGYHFIYPKSRRSKPALMRFRRWLRHEAKRTWGETQLLLDESGG
ncbi:LysR substrate-binding domain-containing protein [Acuticoccus sp. M5D2P5]|uniref:LysR substrate-binding domain-containing protein n=1 Tax=Acuticoccus kalidii TaxID=2910977 RepID=UPI001F43F515|nr:LysR substrate-binding domain-containing protein [Acuticoccus kalidii]MCF3934809.1 LysR substrate-binding domain-containing protein [Acuticoccus kalidii]